jgi:hypothetical protein
MKLAVVRACRVMAMASIVLWYSVIALSAIVAICLSAQTKLWDYQQRIMRLTAAP